MHAGSVAPVVPEFSPYTSTLAACPDTVRRNSIALYYYTVDRPQDEVRFSKSTMTNYQPRPSEKFGQGRLHHLVNQIEIRFPLTRRFLSLARRLR